MNESFEIQGIWYLSEQDMNNDGVEGILKYSPNKIVLELIGTFRGESDETLFAMRQSPEKKIIYGFSNYGEKITLFDCFPSNTKFNAPGFATTSYIVNWFFAGTQYISSDSEEIIKSCAFSFTYLDAWLDLRIVNIAINRENGNADISIDMNKALMQKKHLVIPNEDIDICEEINWHIIYPKEYYSEETVKITASRFYRIASTSGSSLSYSKCFDILDILGRLLTMLIGSPLHLLYIDLNLPTERRSSFDGNEVEYRHCCRAFFTQVGDINKIQNISPDKPGSMLIFRKDISDHIEDIFGNWFLNQDKLSEVINPYIMDLYLPAYQEARFLNIVRCLETYHRYFLEESDVAPQIIDMIFVEERKTILSFIADNINSENKQDFIDRIKYEDEGSLQKRLKGMFRQTPTILFTKLFGQLNSSQLNKIALMIAQTRNYFTHRDSKGKYPLAIDSRTVLDSYIEKLNVILQFWILKSMGVDPSIIEKRLSEYTKNYSAFSDNIDLYHHSE